MQPHFSLKVNPLFSSTATDFAAAPTRWKRQFVRKIIKRTAITALNKSPSLDRQFICFLSNGSYKSNFFPTFRHLPDVASMAANQLNDFARVANGAVSEQEE